MKFDGTETHNGMEYHILRAYNCIDTNLKPTSFDYLNTIWLLREEDGIVYYLDTNWLVDDSDYSEQGKGSAREYVLYNFNIQPGESFDGLAMIYNEFAPVKITCNGIEKMMINNQETKLFHLSTEFCPDGFEVLENVGIISKWVFLPYLNIIDDESDPYKGRYLFTKYSDTEGNVLYQRDDSSDARLISDSRIWEYLYFSPDQTEGMLIRRSFTETKKIENQFYHKFSTLSALKWDRIYDDVSGLWIDSEPCECEYKMPYEGWLREEYMKIYMYVKGMDIPGIPEGTEEILLYDFDGNKATPDYQSGLFNVDATFTPSTMTVDRISLFDDNGDIIKIDGAECIFFFVTSPNLDSQILLEGVGPINQGMVDMPLNYPSTEHYTITLNNLYDEENNIIFKGIDYHSTFSGIDSIHTTDSSVRYYNLQGQPVYDPKKGEFVICVAGDGRVSKLIKNY